jgi:transcriptional regulator with XRE-family HTH domain
MAKQSPESQQRIAAKAAEIRQSVALNLLREELQMSQTEMAAAMGIKQPTIAKMEQADNDPRLSTLKRYIAALGGELSINVTLPTGKKSRLICEQVSGPSASHSPGISLLAPRDVRTLTTAQTFPHAAPAIR